MLPSDGIESLKGIGEKSAAAFHTAGIYSINDLLHYLPRTYESLSPIRPMASINSDGKYTLAGRVLAPASVFYKNGKTMLRIPFGDGSAQGQLTIFNMPYLKKNFPPGRELIVSVYAKRKKNTLFLSQPKIYSKSEYEAALGKLKPVYPATSHLRSAAVYKAVVQALPLLSDMKDYLSDKSLLELKLLSLPEAIRAMHAPKDMDEAKAGRQRLAFDEFFLFLARMELLGGGKELIATDLVFSDGKAQADALIKRLPYELSGAQQRALNDIFKDLSGGYCMNRLLQGDVGSGKTIVAMSAALAVIAHGYQAVLMAPTEVLARQHFNEAERYSREFELPFAPQLLCGSMTAKQKREAKERIAAGEAKFIIGTHALIEEDVRIPGAALVITDEQHRFGVRQRMLLNDKRALSHVLVMSATPIPRTLGLILYGDLDVSLIDELPAGRLGIKNAIVDESWRDKLYQFLVKHIREGRQAYIICPMVEEGVDDESELNNVTDYTEELKQRLPKDVRIDMLHGRMKGADKNAVMERFSAHESDILVSTTVVEVGVNVPNATIMVIENAERFGLAQLHQLRGRVGRGEQQSYCVFVSGSAEQKTGKKAMERLNILKESNDGFVIAEEDLKQRGPGDFFGLRQSGTPIFAIADIYSDAKQLSAAKSCLARMLSEDEAALGRLKEALRQKEDLSYSEFHGICL